MGNLKAITDKNEYDVVSNVTWENGRIYFIKSDEDEGATLSVTVTFNDKDKYSETQGVVDLELPKVNNLNGNYYYSFPSDIIELFGGEFTARTPTPTPEQETPTPFLLSCISKDTTVEIVDDGGYKYAFGPNGYQTPFKLNVGIYKLSVHKDHPLYLHGNDESQIKISGSTKVGIGYINDVEITVYSDFGTISYGCTAHGWMGGENNLVFDANCGLGYELPTPTPEEETPTPLGQPQSYDDIPWLTTTAKFVVATDSENDYSKLILENTSFDFDEYPFKDNIPSKSSYPSFYVYILKDSFDGSLMDIYSQGNGNEYSGSNSLGYFYNYINGEKQSSIAFSSNSGGGLAYVVDDLVAGRTASYPTNADIIADDTYGFSNFEDWLGTDTHIKVGILGFDYDPSAGVDVMLAEYFIPCTIEFEPTPTPEPPIAELETWLTFDSSTFFTDADAQSNGEPPYRLVLENLKITEANIPSKIKNAISSNKLRVICYPVRDTYTGSLFTPTGSDSMGSNIDTTVFFSYGDLSNQINEYGTYNSSLNWNDQVRLGSFWNFYSDFANGLTVGSALYSYDGDDFSTWKGTDGVKLGFGIAIANSDTDYEVLYNKRYNLQISIFVEQTPTPLAPFLLDASDPTYIQYPNIQGNHNSWSLETLSDYGNSIGYKNNAYKMFVDINGFVLFKTSDNQNVSGLKIWPTSDWNQVLNGSVEPVDMVYGWCFISFDGDVGSVSAFNQNQNTPFIEDLFVYSEQAPEGSYIPPELPTPTPEQTPTPTPEQTPTPTPEQTPTPTPEQTPTPKKTPTPTPEQTPTPTPEQTPTPTPEKTPTPTPYGFDMLETWFSSDQTKFQIYGEDDANSQEKAAFVKFDSLSINRQSLHNDLNSSIVQITLYIIDKNSHTDTDYGGVNTQVVSDDVLCSSMILNSTLDEQSNSFFLYNTFGSQTEYGSQVTQGLYWNKSDLSINEETAYFRISPSTFLKNVEDYDNVALVFQVATLSYDIFGAPLYHYHKFENALVKEEWGVQTPTPLPQPTPTPTPEIVYEANNTDWSVYTSDPSLDTLLSQFNSNDLDNTTTSDPDSSFTGIYDSRDNDGTGWVTTYLNGALHGYSKQYQNNVLTWELYYNNNSTVGVSRKWWASTGHLREVIIYSNGNIVGRVLWQEYETEPYIDDLRRPKVRINSLSYQQDTFRDILFDFTIENPDLYPVNSFELSYKKEGLPFDNFQFDNYGHTITFNLSDVTLNDINSSSDKTFEYSLSDVDSDIVEGDLLYYRIRGIGSVEGTYEYFSGYYISEPTPTPTQTPTPTPKETPTPIPQDLPTPTPIESRIVVRFNAQQASNIGNFSIIIRSLDGGTSTAKVYNSVYTYNADDALETVVYDDTHAGGWQPFSSALVYEKYGYHDNNINGWILEVTGDIKSLKIHNSLYGNSEHNGVSSIELYGCDGIHEIPDFDSGHYPNLNYVHFKNFDAGSLIKTNPFEGMFRNQTNLYTVYGLDTIRNLENIISTAEMFNGCTSLNVDQYANSQTGASMKFGSNWSTAPITNVNHMFSNCTSLNYNNGPDFSEWCVSEIQTEPPSFASGATFTNRPRFGNECGNVNLGGSVIDGYVKNAPGQLIDLSNGNIIKEFTSDDYGRWSIDIEQSELPDLYKVKFLPGGIDILTNKQVNTTFSNIAKKEDTLTSSSTLNITPVTTLKSTIVETKIQQKKDSGESYDVDSIITTTKQFVASKFDISETDLESDYIKEQKADVLKANTKLSIITETLKSTVSQVDDSVTEDIIFASIATQFKSTMETEETSNEDISVTDLLNNNIETIVKNSVDDLFQTQITSDSSIVQNIEFLSEVVLEVIDTPSDTENSDTFEDSLQNVRKEILTTIEFVEDVVSTSDIGNEEVVMNKESALESIDNSIDLVEDIVIDDMIQPELGAEEQTPTPTFASYYFAEENQSNSHTFQKYHQDEQMIAYDNFINGVLFDVLVMKNEGFVEVYIGSGGATSVRLGTLSSEYQSNHASGLNWVNYFESTYEGLSISTTSIQSQINMIIPNSLLEMA